MHLTAVVLVFLVLLVLNGDDEGLEGRLSDVARDYAMISIAEMDVAAEHQLFLLLFLFIHLVFLFVFHFHLNVLQFHLNRPSSFSSFAPL